MIQLDVACDIESVCCVHNANFELVLVINQVGYVVVVAAPGVRNFLRLRAVHQDVHAHIVGIQDLLELLFDFRIDNVHASSPRIDLFDEVELCLNVCLFLFQF